MNKGNMIHKYVSMSTNRVPLIKLLSAGSKLTAPIRLDWEKPFSCLPFKLSLWLPFTPQPLVTVIKINVPTDFFF